MLKVASLAAHRRSWSGCSSLLYLKTSPKMKIESVKAEREKKVQAARNTQAPAAAISNRQT
jgi:hypothetical protein